MKLSGYNVGNNEKVVLAFWYHNLQKQYKNVLRQKIKIKNVCAKLSQTFLFQTDTL